MLFTEAFRALGYEVLVPRTDWSADSASGVCLSLWAKEIKYSGGVCTFDTRRDAQPIGTWNRKPGFKRRFEHLVRAVEEFDSAVDAIVVSGTPGGSYEDATPWRPEERKGMKWFVTALDRESGQFAAETRQVGV